MSRQQRILEIHRRLKKGRPFTAVQLAQEMNCSERTIRRYIESLRTDLDMPVEFDPIENTWHYTKEVTDIPATLMDAEDRRALLIARQAFEQFAGTPWHAKLIRAMDKLLATLPEEVQTDFEKLARCIRFEGSPMPQVTTAIWDTICICLEASETLKIEYRTGRSGEVRWREVDPYGLVVHNREWYLVGWDHFRQAVRTFFLPRIQKTEYTEKQFQVRDGFDLNTYLATAVDSHQSTGKVHRVKLRFKKELAAMGEESIWNATQKVSRDKGGRIVVEFKTGALYAVERQVLAWGGVVEVVAPTRLVQRVAQLATFVAVAHQSKYRD